MAMNPDKDPTTGEVVSEETGEVVAGALTFEQAHATFKNFITDNRDRNNKNAAIARKLNGEQPWNPRKIKAAGQSWRSNRPTGFMSSLIKRIAPPYKQVIDQLPLLTFSKFRHEADGNDTLEDVFRRAITNCVRRWDGWADFVSQLVDENITYGYAAVGRVNEFTWKPKMFRSDEALFYIGCPQEAKHVKIWGLREDLYVNDMVEILKDPEISAMAGWYTENLAKKLNASTRQYDDKSSQENERVYEDLARENNLASSFTSTVRVIKAGHLFVLDPAGGIDHYLFDRDDGTELFFRRGRYRTMDQCLSLFTAEVGDRTLHGSRGAGRALYNTHVSVEQARNLIQDALHLSGLLLLKKSSAVGTGSSENPSLAVNHPFAIVGDGYEVLEKVKFEIDSEAFFALDRHATQQAEIAVGAFMPGQILDQGGAKRTASEVNYTASIDAQIRAGMLARFAEQMFTLVDQLQQRICSPEVIQAAKLIFDEIAKTNGSRPVFSKDMWESLEAAGQSQGWFFAELSPTLDQDAVECVLEMLEKGLTVAQILALAFSSSRSSVDDAIASQSGALNMVVQRYIADPMIDTVELKRRDISSFVGADAAARLMNVDLSPMSQLKQQRQQLIEMTTLLGGGPVPVDPTDDDLVHLNAIIARVAPLISAELPMESSRKLLSGILPHAEEHVKSAIKKGAKQSDLSEIIGILDEAKAMLGGPSTEGRAAEAVGAVTNQGGFPVTQPPASSGTPPPALSPSTAGIIGAVADPVRPTPPRGNIAQ
jgi:hypothetical protein